MVVPTEDGPLLAAELRRRTVSGVWAISLAALVLFPATKPANIILCERGGEPDVVKVVDFGLAKDIRASDVQLSRAGYLTGQAWVRTPGRQEPSDLNRLRGQCPEVCKWRGESLRLLRRPNPN
jgi:serine/threonine protein kinase